MPLLIDNRIAEQALNMNDAIDAMESALKQLADGDAVYQPRTDLWSPTATVGDYFRWGSLLGAIKDPPILAFRFKLDIMTWQEYSGAVTEHWFNVEPGKYCGIILLVDTRTGELLCIMNDGYLQSYRVGATAGGRSEASLPRRLQGHGGSGFRSHGPPPTPWPRAPSAPSSTSRSSAPRPPIGTPTPRRWRRPSRCGSPP